MKKTYQLFLVFVASALSAVAQPTLTFSPFATGLSRVVDIRHCNDSRLFMVQQAGKIIICDSLGTPRATPFLDLAGISSNPSSAGDERGLLGMAFHPNFKQNGYFYVNYTASSGGATKIVRYTVNPLDSNLADASSALILLSITQPFSNHNGGCLRFGPDGYLYIGTGDGGSGYDPNGNGQNLTVLLGKMLRLDVDNPLPPLNYGIPASNPYVGTANRGEIWSYGLRNPWKWAFDRIYGDIWIADVGQSAWEEVNYEPMGATGGRNYGWRCYEGLLPTPTINQANCPAFNTTVAPIAVFDHSTGCSITGGYIYRGGKYNDLNGYYIYTDYCDSKIRLTKNNYDGTFTTYNLGTVAGTGEYVAFGEDYRGELYLANKFNGTVRKIGTSTCAPTAAIIGNTNEITICPGASYPNLSAIYNPENTYEWYKDGLAIAGATNHNYTPIEVGVYTVLVTNPTACTSESSELTISISTQPVVTMTDLDASVCDTDAPLNLVGTPAGGVFSGIGIIGNTFDPSIAGAGAFDLFYTYTDPNGCGFDTVIVQAIDVTVCTGISQNTKANNLQLYPNPNEGNFTVEFTASAGTLVQFYITDITGKIVFNSQSTATKGLNRVNLQVNDLQKGFYILKTSDLQSEINKSFIVR